jgi:hypothetical protein
MTAMKTKIPTTKVVLTDSDHHEIGLLNVPNLKEPFDVIAWNDRFFKRVGYGYPHERYMEFESLFVSETAELIPPEPKPAKAAIAEPEPVDASQQPTEPQAAF